MDIKAIEAMMGEDPNAEENGKFYRELLDSSETIDSESLTKFVEDLKKQNPDEEEEGEEEPKETEGVKDHRRMVTFDRSADIEYFTSEQLGPRRELTPEGFLICYDVPVARTGEMIYGPDETPIKVGKDGRAKITRSEAEVFSPKSIASLKGKPVTDDHPPVDVDPSNWRFYTRGVVSDPRRGEGEHKNFLVADLIIYDAETIEDIDAGKREVSCGYNPDYLEILDDDGNAIPGAGEQANIIYNHLALVDKGRCGARCAIGDKQYADPVVVTGDPRGSVGDHKTVDHAGGQRKSTIKEKTPMSMKRALRKLNRAFMSKDQIAFDDAMEELENKADDADEGEKQPDTIEVHNHIPGADGIGEIPPKDPATTGVRDDEGDGPDWFKKFSKDCMDRFKGFDDKFEALNSGKTDNPKEGDVHDDEVSDPNMLMDKGRDAKDDEANKKILGELDFEAPPGTNVKDAKSAKDSVYLEDSFQDAVSKAEILAPGIRVPTFDRAMSPIKTAKALFALRRTALDLAYQKPETRGVIDAALSGHTFDSKRMNEGTVRVLFNAVSAQVAQDNNKRSTTDTRTVGRNALGGGKAAGAQLTTLASINERNKERYGRKSA